MTLRELQSEWGQGWSCQLIIHRPTEEERFIQKGHVDAAFQTSPLQLQFGNLKE